MADVFMFSAQPEVIEKKKPPDIIGGAKRSRTQSDEDGEISKPTDQESESIGSKSDSFGPWMQVSYGRNGRFNQGGQYSGKKVGNMGSVGKNNLSTRKNGPPDHGAGNSGSSKKVQQVDASGATNFDLAASELKEAIEVTLE
ncbi:hypothetical protein Q3G72_033617 [Acer saccharum]|nr:hypothetical protein Q3G72_033617 [Acer saccharum]